MDQDLASRFLQWAFGAAWKEVFVIGFPDDPAKKKGGWPVWKVGECMRRGAWPPRGSDNNYFCVSLFTGSHRQEAQFKSLHVLAIDDVGVKVDSGMLLDRLGTPGLAVETSPGNQHWFYKLLPPVVDPIVAARLTKLAGSDAKSVTRLMRLPVGSNTKGGKAFEVKAIGNGAINGLGEIGDVDELLASWDAAAGVPGGSNPTAVASQGTRLTRRVGTSAADLIGDDLVGNWLVKLGLVKGMISSRLGVEVVCPWEEGHTIKTETGAAYFPDTGGFECHHAHCTDRTGVDLRSYVASEVDKSGLWEGGFAAGLFDPVDDNDVPYREKVIKRFVFVRVENKYLDIEGMDLISIEAFNAVERPRLRQWLQVTDKDNKVKVIAPHAWFMEQKDSLIATKQTYWPGRGLVFKAGGVDLVNRYLPAPRPNRGMAVTAQTVAPWTELVEFVCQDEGPGTSEWVIDWYALVVGSPGIKPGFGLVFQSEFHGIGKDMMLWPILQAVGYSNVATPAAAVVSGAFNSFAEKRLVSVTDLERNTRGAATTHDIYATIKPYTENTSQMVEINRKNCQPYQAFNASAWVITTNAEDAIPLDQTDRRFGVITSRSPPRGPDYYRDKKAWLEGHWGEIAEFLHQRRENMPAARLARLSGHAPATSGKTAMIRQGEDRFTSWSREQIEDGIWPDLMTSRDIQDAYERAGKRVLPYVPSVQKYRSILQRLGAKPYKDNVTVRLSDSLISRVWIMRCPSTFETSTPKEIAAAFKKQSESNM